MLEDVLVPIISIIPENPKLINCFASGQPLIIKEPESKTSNSFTQLASYLMGQSFTSIIKDLYPDLYVVL